MKKIFIAMLIFIVTVVYGGITEIYNERVEKSTAFMLSENSFNQAVRTLDEKKSFWIPGLTAGFDQIIFGKDGLENKNIVNGHKSIRLNLKANFVKILGASIGVSLPYVYDLTDYSGKFENFNLTVSRPLFTEFYLEVPQAELSVMQSKNAMEKTRWDIFSQLLQDIFNYHNALSTRELINGRTYVTEILYENENDNEKKKTYRQQLTELNKLSINNELVLNGLNLEYCAELYSQAVQICEKMVLISEDCTQVNFNGTELPSVLLKEDIARRQKEMWFLPYLPNPVISFGIDLLDSLKWHVGLSFEYSFFEKGTVSSKSVESSNRISQYEIAVLQTANAKESIQHSIEKLKKDLEIYKMEVFASKANMDDSLAELAKNKLLMEKGYITKEKYDLESYEHISKKLDYEKTLQSMYLTCVKLLQEYGLPAGGGML